MSYGSGLGGSSGSAGSCLSFHYEALKGATKSFKQEEVSDGGCKLGEGRFGSVFLGNLFNTQVAIKVLRRVSLTVSDLWEFHDKVSSSDVMTGRQRS